MFGELKSNDIFVKEERFCKDLVSWSGKHWIRVTLHLPNRTPPFSVQQSKVGMLGKCLASPLLTFDSTLRFYSYSDSTSVATSKLLIKSNIRNSVPTRIVSSSWELHSTAPSQNAVVSDEDDTTWESCKQAIVSFGFSDMEVEKILGKAYGRIHSPYWGEERNKESPRFEVVNEILNYLKDLGLTDEDLGKLLKKFPEVLGCSLENELKTNVQILEKEWGIKGKPLRNLLLRNPKVLGYNVDCKGDCMAQCTRCWVRF